MEGNEQEHIDDSTSDDMLAPFYVSMKTMGRWSVTNNFSTMLDYTCNQYFKGSEMSWRICVNSMNNQLLNQAQLIYQSGKYFMITII